MFYTLLKPKLTSENSSREKSNLCEFCFCQFVKSANRTVAKLIAAQQRSSRFLKYLAAGLTKTDM